MKYEHNYAKLAEFGRTILDIELIDDILPYIATYARQTLGADRCSIFVYDKKTQKLWTTLADQVDRIIIPSDRGLVGYVLSTKESLIENHPYSNEHFYKEVDIETGYITKNIILAPVLGSNGDPIGVLELLNKDNGFDEEDAKFMKFFTHYISGFLELAAINDHPDKKK